jgi:hypothetical protein
MSECIKLIGQLCGKSEGNIHIEIIHKAHKVDLPLCPKCSRRLKKRGSTLFSQSESSTDNGSDFQGRWNEL